MNLHELSEDRDVKKDETNESAVKIEKASFSWSNADEPTLKNIDVEIKKKSLTAIVGSVGSGKSSLLSAMLGKKPFHNWFNGFLKQNFHFYAPAISP